MTEEWLARDGTACVESVSAVRTNHALTAATLHHPTSFQTAVTS